MKKITDEELISFFNNLKEIIQAQKELNHVLAKRITNIETKVKEHEKIPDSEKLSQYVQLALTKYVMGHERKRG